MLLEDKIKIALNGYKEDLIDGDQAVKYIVKTMQNECEKCSHKNVTDDLKAAMATIERAIEEDYICPFVPNVLGVECTE